MNKLNSYTLAATLILASASAIAAHCPADMQAIDNALKANPALSAEQLNQVKKYRADGEALHKAGHAGEGA
jgi:hypothetical protein